jgi:hypothetical protein
MEIVGGFMVMMSILGFFLAVIWLIMPFVVFATKGKLDRTLEVLDGMEKRLAGIESQIAALRQAQGRTVAGPQATETLSDGEEPS